MKSFLPIILSALMLSSCDMMHEDRSDCPYGLYLKFKYDYNLQRADMFNDHVQALTLYVFDEEGNFVTRQTDANGLESQPLECPCYQMHLTGLAPGKYKFIALAETPSPIDPAAAAAEQRAKFRIAGESDIRSFGHSGAKITDLDIMLDRIQTGYGNYTVDNHSLPLDTIWHGMDMRGVEVTSMIDSSPVYDTISLVRDTKQIMVSLCNLDAEEPTDIADYNISIHDRNTHILWDNSLNETDRVTYTPYDIWNTDKMAHAQFMTARLLWHEDQADDARLSVWSSKTDKEVINLSLANLLCNLRNSDDRHRYSPQEFLDRGYDYNIEFYIKGGKVEYANIGVTVGILSWAKRVQLVEL